MYMVNVVLLLVGTPHSGEPVLELLGSTCSMVREVQIRRLHLINYLFCMICTLPVDWWDCLGLVGCLVMALFGVQDQDSGAGRARCLGVDWA